MIDHGKSGAWRVLDLLLLLAAAVVFLVALGLYVRFWDETFERISTASMDIHADFDSFWRSARAMWEGRDIYDAGARLTNLNPPFWTVLLAPFGLIDALVAYRTFASILLVTTVGYVAWMAMELRMRGGLAALGAVMLLFCSPMFGTLALGQVYPVLALGLVAAWVWDREGRSVASGISLGLVVAIKPSLLPVLLWPAVRGKWKALGAALGSGAAATLLGVAVLGPEATLEYVQILRREELTAYWDNASLPSSAARLFTGNEFARPLVELPWMVPVAYAAGLAVLGYTVWKARSNPEIGLWALVAASLLASPIAWHNYLVLLGPGVLLLLARGKMVLALFLISLQLIPQQWTLLWIGKDTILATLMLTLYLYILAAHWLAFVTFRGEPESAGAKPAHGAVL